MTTGMAETVVQRLFDDARHTALRRQAQQVGQLQPFRGDNGTAAPGVGRHDVGQGGGFAPARGQQAVRDLAQFDLDAVCRRLHLVDVIRSVAAAAGDPGQVVERKAEVSQHLHRAVVQFLSDAPAHLLVHLLQLAARRVQPGPQADGIDLQILTLFLNLGDRGLLGVDGAAALTKHREQARKDRQTAQGQDEPVHPQQLVKFAAHPGRVLVEFADRNDGPVGTAAQRHVDFEDRPIEFPLEDVFLVREVIEIGSRLTRKGEGQVVGAEILAHQIAVRGVHDGAGRVPDLDRPHMSPQRRVRHDRVERRAVRRRQRTPAGHALDVGFKEGGHVKGGRGLAMIEKVGRDARRHERSKADDDDRDRKKRRQKKLEFQRHTAPSNRVHRP